MSPAWLVVIAAASTVIAVLAIRGMFRRRSTTLPVWKLSACLAAGWFAGIPAGWLVVEAASAGLSARMASAIGVVIALVLYGVCTTALVRAAGDSTFRLQFALALGLLQLIVVVATGLTVMSLAYWLFGG